MIIRNGRNMDILAFELWVEQLETATTNSIVSEVPTILNIINRVLHSKVKSPMTS